MDAPERAGPKNLKTSQSFIWAAAAAPIIPLPDSSPIFIAAETSPVASAKRTLATSSTAAIDAKAMADTAAAITFFILFLSVVVCCVYVSCACRGGR